MSETKQLTPQENFQERMVNRLREDIGDLLPDEVLSEMVQKAIEKMLYEPLVVRDTQYGQPKAKTLKYSWFEDYIQKLLRERFSLHVKMWMKENEDKLVELFEKTMVSVMPQIVAKAIFKPVDQQINDVDTELRKQIAFWIEENFPNGTRQFVG